MIPFFLIVLSDRQRIQSPLLQRRACLDVRLMLLNYGCSTTLRGTWSSPTQQKPESSLHPKQPLRSAGRICPCTQELFSSARSLSATHRSVQPFHSTVGRSSCSSGGHSPRSLRRGHSPRTAHTTPDQFHPNLTAREFQNS